jgi:hypothetical protein
VSDPVPLTDEDALKELEAADAQSVAASPLAAVPLTDADALAHLESHTSLSFAPPDAVAGQNGLVWNKDGGYDPKTGELVITGKPMDNVNSGVGITANILNGIPIVGPAIESGAVKAAALARSYLYGEPADKIEAALQGGIADYRRHHPNVTTAANVGGAILGTVPAAETAIGARALGLVGSLPVKIAQGVAGGGAIGGADAYTRGESSTAGAISGAVLGAASPAVGATIGAIARPIINALPSAVKAPLQDLSSTARTWLSNAVQGETPASIQAAHEALGPNAFVGDLNHPLSRLTKSIADQPEAAAGDIRAAYAARNAADGDRINAAITDALGPEQDLTALTGSEKAARSAAGDPLYEAWKATPIPPTDELRALMPRLNAAGVSNGAANKAAIEGVPGAHEWFKQLPDGSLSLDTEAMPTSQAYDFMKQALDDKIGVARRAGEDGQARLYSKLKNDLVSAIDNHPDPNVAGIWQQARQAWADPTAIMTARNEGATALSRATDVNELRDQIQNYSLPERHAFTQGLRGYAANVFGATKNGDTAIKNQLLAPNSQRKLEYLIGPDRTEALIRSLNQEDALAASAKRITGGSPTNENAQANHLSGAAAVPGAVADYARNFALDRPATCDLAPLS